MVEMTVESVRINLATQQRVVILKATKQERYLFIWIAYAEAYAIAVELQGTTSPRHSTHDLLKNVMNELEAKIVSMVISDLIDDIYYARIVLDVAGRHVESIPVPAMRLPWQYAQRRQSTLRKACWSEPGWPWKRTMSSRA